MDILPHTLSGVAVATRASLMPSLWPGLDRRIGAHFGPAKGTVIYTGRWWWHNHDVFLSILLCVVLNMVVLACAEWLKQTMPKFTCSIFLLTSGLVLYQINTRQDDYAYNGNALNHAQIDTHKKARR